MIELREYQREAVGAVYEHLRGRDDHPCVVIPTGGGKTPVMAQVCMDAAARWNGRVLVLAHVRELLEQTAGTLRDMAPELDVGVYSAGLGRRDTEHAVIVAGIQSAYRRAAELGPFDLVMVDEAHCIPADGEGMYRTFLSDALLVNPNVRLIGLTATPYRMATGMICAPDNLLNHVCYEIGVRELIVQGYLCALKTKAGRQKADTSGLHVRAGEFIASETEALMDRDELVKSACAEIIEYTRDRHSCLIFASGILHGRHVRDVLRAEHGVACECVFGETPSRERDEALARFRGNGDGLFSEPLPYLVNVNVLTTGFDAPNIDCIAMLRPTMSPGLYYQMCLDAATEVLVPGGWAKSNEVNVGDAVGAYDVSSGEIVWCEAQDKVTRPLRNDECMYGISAPHLNVRVTDRHTMIYRGCSKTSRRWKNAEARQLALRRGSYRVPVASEGDGRGVALSDDELRFLGWALGDGHRNPHNNAVIICQSAASPYNETIESVLRGCGFGYRLYRTQRSGGLAQYADAFQYVVPYGSPRGKNRGLRGWGHLALYFNAPICSTLDAISHRQLGVMLSAMNLADGHKPDVPWTQRTMHIAVGNRPFLANQLQNLCVRRGFRCNRSEQRIRTSWHQGDAQVQYILHIRPQTTATVGGASYRPNRLVKKRSTLKPVSYTLGETVWCLTTAHGTLVTRRNGKVCVLGNCGRGFRTDPGKQDCLVLDFGGNVVRHGPVDAICIAERPGAGGEAPAKECPKCHELVAAGYARCPVCGYEFPPPERRKHAGQASTAAVLSGEVTTAEYSVEEVFYGVHRKNGAPDDHPRTMRVEYRVGWQHWQNEFICFEHTGYARVKAERWWRERTDWPVPGSVEEAVEAARAGALCETLSITARRVAGEKYASIVGYQLGPKPLGGCDREGNVLTEEIPF
jgi:hypothetical protein